MTHRLSRTDAMDVDVGDDRTDALFDALAHPYRRFTLHYLLLVDAPAPVSALAMELSAWEAERPLTDRSVGDRESIELSLRHNHLPRMAEASAVAYDDVERTVELDGEASRIRALLDAT